MSFTWTRPESGAGTGGASTSTHLGVSPQTVTSAVCMVDIVETLNLEGVKGL